jgi:hypothetical protein
VTTNGGVPDASLASLTPYAVPAGARLAFRYVVSTTDGFMRGDVLLVFSNGGAAHVIAHGIPVMGGSRQVKAIGDYAKIFPDPIPVASGSES